MRGANVAQGQGVELLQSRLAREPTHAGLWHELATRALQLGRLPDAVAAATTAVTFAPDGLEPRLGLALALAAGGDFAPAIVHYEMAVKLARILLFSGRCEEWSVLLQRRFRRTMPEVADRVQFLPRQPHPRFLQIVSLADVMLDTVHFNGMITSIEALSVGTPVVTLPGALQRGRATQAMYRAMGIDGMVAATADEYANIACDTAMNPDRREALRRLIADRRHLLFEDRRAIAEFERFFQAAHLEKCRP